MEAILKYFTDLSEKQLSQLEQLQPLYAEWNEKINVVSRKDVDQIYEHHILHSLSVAKLIKLKGGAEILDLGTGGGLPGIPLAILFPETKFTLIDARSKKITVVSDLIHQLKLDNAKAIHGRAEELKTQYDFVLARAVTAIDKLYAWSLRLIHTNQVHSIPNGLIAFKGGHIDEEMKLLPKEVYWEKHVISDYFDEPYYQEKFLVYVQR